MLAVEKQGIAVSKKERKQGIVKLDDSHTRKREGSGELLCGTFHTKPEFAPLWGLQLSIGTSHLFLFLFLRNPN